MTEIKLTRAEFSQYVGLLPAPELRDWLKTLEVTSNSSGTAIYLDLKAESLLYCPGALLFASDLTAKSANFPVHAKYIRPGCGVPTNQQIVDSIVVDHYRGSIINEAGKRVDLGPELPVTYELCSANVYTGPSLKWSTDYAASIVPITNPAGGVAIPFFGGFYRRGLDLADCSSVNFPLKIALEDNGQRTAQPAFRQGGRSIVIPADTHLHLKVLSSGGLELPTDPVLNEDGFKRVPVIAFQWVGAGHRNYISHYWPSEGALSQSDAYLMVGGQEDGELEVTRPENWGCSGVFLDQRHKRVSTAPTGGMVDCDDVVEMQRRLLLNGAYIGAITVGYVPLISKSQLDQLLGCDSDAPFDDFLQVQVKAICDSTARLSTLFADDLDGEIGGENSVPDMWRATARYMRLYSVATSYFDDAENKIDRYLSRLGSVMGSNFRSAILSELTVPWYDRASDNLSLTGMLCDVENFETCTEPYNFTSMAKEWISILVFISQFVFDDNLQKLKMTLQSFWNAASNDDRANGEDINRLIAAHNLSADTSSSKDVADSDLTITAAARITGRVVAEVYAEQKPNFRPETSKILAVVKECESRRLLSEAAREIREELEVNPLPASWTTIAPKYYEMLAELAILEFDSGQEKPRIEWT